MQREYRVKIYLLIPVIFTGLSLIALIGAYEITDYVRRAGQEPFRFVVYWALIIISLCGAVSILVARRIMRPLERFIDRVERNSIFRASRTRGQTQAQPEQPEAQRPADEFSRMTQVFDHLSEILDVIEARELFPSIVGQSPAMRAVMAQVKSVAQSDATVLLLGESGVGKDLVARTMHDMSPRRDHPMVSLNCAAIPEGLLESELFGHERGAFTGAHERRLGKFELADKGTLFLDEIGDMPLSTQAKLLRVLQDKTFERVGGNRPIRTDIRIIAATNQDLSERIRDQRFREDLYYRINVVRIPIPPMRERHGDVVLLAHHFLALHGQEYSIDDKALNALSLYAWPGNVRELANVMERAAILCDGVVKMEHLPPELRNLQQSGSEDGAELLPADERHGAQATDNPLADALPFSDSLDEHLARVEKDMIRRALKQTGGVQVRAAELLGIKDRSMWHRVKKHGIVVGKTENAKK
jgi:transcriptional regulator with GAF, ATPase, and Fis domain